MTIDERLGSIAKWAFISIICGSIVFIALYQDSYEAFMLECTQHIVGFECIQMWEMYRER